MLYFYLTWSLVVFMPILLVASLHYYFPNIQWYYLALIGCLLLFFDIMSVELIGKVVYFFLDNPFQRNIEPFKIKHSEEEVVAKMILLVIKTYYLDYNAFIQGWPVNSNNSLITDAYTILAECRSKDKRSFDTAKIEANKIILEDIRLKLITNEK